MKTNYDDPSTLGNILPFGMYVYDTNPLIFLSNESFDVNLKDKDVVEVGENFIATISVVNADKKPAANEF